MGTGVIHTDKSNIIIIFQLVHDVIRVQNGNCCRFSGVFFPQHREIRMTDGQNTGTREFRRADPFHLTFRTIR